VTTAAEKKGRGGGYALKTKGKGANQTTKRRSPRQTKRIGAKGEKGRTLGAAEGFPNRKRERIINNREEKEGAKTNQKLYVLEEKLKTQNSNPVANTNEKRPLTEKKFSKTLQGEEGKKRGYVTSGQSHGASSWGRVSCHPAVVFGALMKNHIVGKGGGRVCGMCPFAWSNEHFPPG